MTEANTQGTVAKAVRSYFTEFARLKSCPREFWVVQLVNLLDAVAYFATFTVVTVYLSETLGYTDASAANLWAVCMGVLTITGFMAGFVGDSLGIKRTLYLSVVLIMISRVVISLTEQRMVVVPGLFLFAIGTAIMTPILISATKRYTTKESQTAGFNLLYLLMNVGAFLGNFLLDSMRDSAWGNRTVFMMGSAMSVLCFLAILLFWRKGIAQVDAQTKADQAKSGKEWEAPWTIARSVMRESAFWRFMLFLVVLIGVRLVFEHQSQIYPKYWQRTISEHLFRVETGFVGELQNEGVSDALRQKFAEADVSLSEDVAVAIERKGVRWLITDKEQHFRIERAFTLEVSGASGTAAPDPSVGWLTPELDGQDIQQLKGGQVPPALRDSFSRHERKLSEHPEVSYVRGTNLWTILDADRAYSIRIAGGTLHAHRMPAPNENHTGQAEPEPEALFTTPVGTLGRLDDGAVTDALRAAFAMHDLPLPENVTAEIKETSTRWQLVTPADTYYVHNDAEKLSISATDARIGRLNSINPFIICLGVIISTPIVARFKLFNVMFFGIVISSLSMLLLAIYPGWFTARLGITIHQGYQLIIVAQIVMFGLGELIWYPRLYEYTAAIAPAGREASYMGLSSLPMFMARFAEGPLAGKMLTDYCPADMGSRLTEVSYWQSPQMMCLILALIAISSPVLIVLFKGVIQKESRLEAE